MPLYIPDIYDFKLGTSGVTKIMLGVEEVWPLRKTEYTMEKVTSIEEIVIGDKYVIANDAKDKIGYLYYFNPVLYPHDGNYRYSGLTVGDSGYTIDRASILTAMASGVSDYGSSYVSMNSYDNYAVSSSRKYDQPEARGEVIMEIVYGWGPPATPYNYGLIFLENGMLTDKIWEYQWKEDPSSPLHVYDEPWHFAFKITEDYDVGNPYVVGGIFDNVLDKAYLYHVTPVS